MSTMDVNEPARKKLRCAEPDLLILLEYTPDEIQEEEEEDDDSVEYHDGGGREQGGGLGAGDGQGESGGEGADGKNDGGGGSKTLRKEYRVYSQVLAKHSNFIDASLTVNMKEKETKTIVFRDVTPKVFEKALSYLEDPAASFDIKPKDILEVVEFYHLYQFTAGLKLADKVLYNYFGSEIHSDTVSEDLDFLLNTICVVHRLGLKRALDRGRFVITYITRSMCKMTPTMLSEERVALIQPLLVDKKIELPQNMELSAEEISSTLFPKYFVNYVSAFGGNHVSAFGGPTHNTPQLRIKFKKRKEEVAFFQTTKREITKAALDGETTGTTIGRPLGPNHWRLQNKEHLVIDGEKAMVVIERTNRGEGGHNEEYISDKEKHGDWGIFLYDLPDEDEEDDLDEDETCRAWSIYWAPYSAHLEFPPMEPWISTDAGNSLGAPKLSYITR